MTLHYASIDLSKRHFAKAMTYVALSRIKSLDGLNLLAVKDTNVLTLKPNQTPCDDDAVRELSRLRLRKIGIVEETELMEILDWITDFPVCVNCMKWICKCVCK